MSTGNPPGKQGSDETEDDSNKKAATDHREEGENANADLKDDGDKRKFMISNLVESDHLSSVLYPDEDVHHVVQDDRHPVVEERLAKDQVVQVRVDPNLNQLFEVFFLN